MILAEVWSGRFVHYSRIQNREVDMSEGKMNYLEQIADTEISIGPTMLFRIILVITKFKDSAFEVRELRNLPFDNCDQITAVNSKTQILTKVRRGTYKFNMKYVPREFIEEPEKVVKHLQFFFPDTKLRMVLKSIQREQKASEDENLIEKKERQFREMTFEIEEMEKEIRQLREERKKLENELNQVGEKEDKFKQFLSTYDISEEEAEYFLKEDD